MNHVPLSQFLVVEEQYEEIVASPDAWLIVTDTESDEAESHPSDLKSTNSARRIKALVEQVTGALYG